MNQGLYFIIPPYCIYFLIGYEYVYLILQPRTRYFFTEFLNSSVCTNNAPTPASSTEETRVKFLKPGRDGLLNFALISELSSA